jgi:response regulator of citrate/malate metabolism
MLFRAARDGAINQQMCDIRIAGGSFLSMQNTKDYVASLARGIEIIRAFTAPQEEERSTLSHRIGPTDALTSSQVAERVGVSRAVARRFLLTLADLGYVATDGKYFKIFQVDGARS